MKKAPSGDDNGLKKGPWTDEEDRKLTGYIHQHGHGKWRTLPKLAGLNRCGKSCRLRWTNYLRPNIKRGKFSIEDEDTIIHLHRVLGNKWSAIAACLPGRTDNEVKNFWNTNVKKKLLRMGIDPVTHTPRLDLLQLASTITNSSLHHTSQLMHDPVLMYTPNTLTYGHNYHYNPPGFGPELGLQNPQHMACPDQALDTRRDVEISYFQNNMSSLGRENGDECSEMRSVCENRTELVPGNSLVLSSEPVYGQTTLNDSWWPGSVYANGGVEGDKGWYCSNSGGFGSYQ